MVIDFSRLNSSSSLTGSTRTSASKAAAEAGDFSSFLKALDGLQADTTDMTNRLAAATFVARIMGGGRDG